MAPQRLDLVNDPLGVPNALFVGAGSALQSFADFLNRTQGRPLGRPAAAAETSGEVRPEGSMATLGGKRVQWMGDRWVPFLTEGEMAREEQRRIRAEAPSAPVLPPPGSNTVIVRGTRDGLTPDRTQSDTYKQYAATPGGQFERYFKTPEMDQYFGAASRGTAAPKDVATMQALAGRTVAPGKTPEELSAFYRAQSAMGRAQMPEIQKGLGYAEGSDMAKWAAANPMLAQRLYVKEMGKREAAGQVTPNTTYAGSKIGSEDFAMAANAVPAPWNQQGVKVSSDFSGVVPFQAAKTTGEGMPAFQTTGEKATEFLRNVKLSSLF